MSSGIRAKVRIDTPDGCPIAQFSGETGGSSRSISKSVDPNTPENVTEEFLVNVDSQDERAGVTEDDLVKIASHRSGTVYRFDRSLGRGCPCEQIEQFGCPVTEIHVRDGALILTFRTPDLDELRNVISALRERYPTLAIQQLHQSYERGEDGERPGYVDQRIITDRQQEVLRTALRMGYFEYPKGANAGEVAEELNIATATFTEHLAAAQNKILDSVLADRHSTPARTPV